MASHETRHTNFQKNKNRKDCQLGKLRVKATTCENTATDDITDD
jgi:hypothetical protein